MKVMHIGERVCGHHFTKPAQCLTTIFQHVFLYSQIRVVFNTSRKFILATDGDNYTKPQWICLQHCSFTKVPGIVAERGGRKILRLRRSEDLLWDCVFSYCQMPHPWSLTNITDQTSTEQGWYAWACQSEQWKPRSSQLYTKNYRHLKNAKSERNGLP